MSKEETLESQTSREGKKNKDKCRKIRHQKMQEMKHTKKQCLSLIIGPHQYVMQGSFPVKCQIINIISLLGGTTFVQLLNSGVAT